MKKNVYLVKEVSIIGDDLDYIEVKAFLDEQKALKYIKNQLKDYINCSENNIITIDDGFDSSIIDDEYNRKILYSCDLMSINKDFNSERIYVYTEVNIYDKEVCAHAIGFLNEEEAKNELIHETNYRVDKNCENHYCLHDGGIEDGYIVLLDEDGNISYLEHGSLSIS